MAPRCAHHFADADFPGALQRPRERQVDEVHPRNAQDDQSQNAHRPDGTAVAVGNGFHRAVGVQVDAAQRLQMKIKAPAILCDVLEVIALNLVDFCLHLPGIGFGLEPQVGEIAGITPVPLRHRFHRLIIFVFLRVGAVGGALFVREIPEVSLLGEQQVEWHVRVGRQIFKHRRHFKFPTADLEPFADGLGRAEQPPGRRFRKRRRVQIRERVLALACEVVQLEHVGKGLLHAEHRDVQNLVFLIRGGDFVGEYFRGSRHFRQLLFCRVPHSPIRLGALETQLVVLIPVMHHAIDLRRVGPERVVVRLIMDVDEDEQARGHRAGQPEQIHQRERPLLRQMPPRHDEVMGKHGGVNQASFRSRSAHRTTARCGALVSSRSANG